jgi:hypothetical protein
MRVTVFGHRAARGDQRLGDRLAAEHAAGALGLLAACSRQGERSGADAARVKSTVSEKTPDPLPTALLCREHDVPELECGICHPELLDEKRPGQRLKVRLPSTNSAGAAGVVVANPTVDQLRQSVECFAELTFNQNKLAQINPLVGGVVKSVEVDLGARARKGALLARIISAATLLIPPRRMAELVGRSRLSATLDRALRGDCALGNHDDREARSARQQVLIRSHTAAMSNGCSGTRTMSAPPAMPSAAIRPAWRPITSTTITRSCSLPSCETVDRAGGDLHRGLGSRR